MWEAGRKETWGVLWLLEVISSLEEESKISNNESCSSSSNHGLQRQVRGYGSSNGERWEQKQFKDSTHA